MDLATRRLAGHEHPSALADLNDWAWTKRKIARTQITIPDLDKQRIERVHNPIMTGVQYWIVGLSLRRLLRRSGLERGDHQRNAARRTSGGFDLRPSDLQ